MNYSTLQEAYNVDSFERKSRPSQKPNKNNGSMIGTTNTSPQGLPGQQSQQGQQGQQGQQSQQSQTFPSYVESSKLALNSCSPLQAPTYNIPISNECKKEHSEAMNVYMNANNNISNTMNNIPTGYTNNIEMLSQQYDSQASQGSQGSQASQASQSSHHSAFQPSSQGSQQSALLPSPASQQSSSQNGANSVNSVNSMNLFNNLKSSNDNVAPYYDEDLEQYFNIADLNDEVKYNSSTSFSSRTNSFMPNSNKQPYTNNDTAEYTNNNALIKNGNNLLNNSSYNLSPEEKKNAQDAILFLKSIEDKINNGDANASGFNKSSIADPVVPTINTGPGGFKIQEKAEEKPVEKPVEKSLNNYIYNAIFNISILLIIGIAIIILCDQMVELSIQIGMKRVVNILEPFIKAQAAHAAMHAQAMQSQAMDGAIITNR
jgi:hypothetical protein